MGQAGLATLARAAGNRVLPPRRRLSSATGHRTDCPETSPCSSWSSSYTPSLDISNRTGVLVSGAPHSREPSKGRLAQASSQVWLQLCCHCRQGTGLGLSGEALLPVGASLTPTLHPATLRWKLEARLLLGEQTRTPPTPGVAVSPSLADPGRSDSIKPDPAQSVADFLSP
ncbi:hypothetical protein P7K49_032496 [Saguinus oedipus]|uniref:Uncharacterized protein n=1 Tax=Saguinus oedipus TaxID=9490 RepID=A0ABQ9TZC5_SAGOE|nr:hypothetical protein P7K49_032496 [Saguinus oedipus]